MRGGKRELRLTGGDDPKFRSLVRKLDQEYVDRFGETALQYRPPVCRNLWIFHLQTVPLHLPMKPHKQVFSHPEYNSNDQYLLTAMEYFFRRR